MDLREPRFLHLGLRASIYRDVFYQMETSKAPNQGRDT